MNEQHSIQLVQVCPFGSQQKPFLLHMVEQHSMGCLHIPLVGVQAEPLDDELALVDDEVLAVELVAFVEELELPPVPLVEEVLAVELVALVEELALEAVLLFEVELALEAVLLFEVELPPVLVAPVEAWLVEPPIPIPVVVERERPPVPLAVLWLPDDADDAPPTPLELVPVPRPPVANGQAMTRNESGSKARARVRRMLRSSAKTCPLVTHRHGRGRARRVRRSEGVGYGLTGGCSGHTLSSHEPYAR